MCGQDSDGNPLWAIRRACVGLPDMRALILILPVIVTGALGCGLTWRGIPAGQKAGLRRFYLTTGTVQGNKAIDACARGYHMASRFEVSDVTMLGYDSSIGLTTDDSGAGPPSHAAAYGSQDPSGWVRTGGSSRFADATERRGTAVTNCAAWSSNSADAYGTVAYLSDRFTVGDGLAAPLWDGGSERCDALHHVWCIEDRATAEGDTSAEMHRRRGRRGGEDRP
jgi:hypothetical protein